MQFYLSHTRAHATACSNCMQQQAAAEATAKRIFCDATSAWKLSFLGIYHIGYAYVRVCVYVCARVTMLLSVCLHKRERLLISCLSHTHTCTLARKESYFLPRTMGQSVSRNCLLHIAELLLGRHAQCYLVQLLVAVVNSSLTKTRSL